MSLIAEAIHDARLELYDFQPGRLSLFDEEEEENNFATMRRAAGFSDRIIFRSAAARARPEARKGRGTFQLDEQRKVGSVGSRRVAAAPAQAVTTVQRDAVMSKVALAGGAQAAVVKVASYGAGGRVTAMMDYLSRDGQLPLENERGEELNGQAAAHTPAEEWADFFEGRKDSRDVASFELTLSDQGEDETALSDEAIRAGLAATLGDRRFAYTVDRDASKATVTGVVVLRDGDGERLSGDLKAGKIVKGRADKAFDGSQATVERFRFRGHGHGVENASARLSRLFESASGPVRRENGQTVGSLEDAKAMAQREWRHVMHSRSARDVMHLVISAKAGTDVDAFKEAARQFLAERFQGHRYVFAVHDPKTDPKREAPGHIHVHAVVTMRSEDGSRLHPNVQTFRHWREAIAEKARGQGIEMEATTRADRGAAPAFNRNQAEAMRNGRASANARQRVDNKRGDRINIPKSPRGREAVVASFAQWKSAAAIAVEPSARITAHRQALRLAVAQQTVEGQNKAEAIEQTARNIIKEIDMATMTREQADRELSSLQKDIGAVQSSLTDPTAQATFERGARMLRDVLQQRLEAAVARSSEQDNRGGSEGGDAGARSQQRGREDEQARDTRERVEQAVEPRGSEPIRQGEAKRGADRAVGQGEKDPQQDANRERTMAEKTRERLAREKSQNRDQER